MCAPIFKTIPKGEPGLKNRSAHQKINPCSGAGGSRQQLVDGLRCPEEFRARSRDLKNTLPCSLHMSKAIGLMIVIITFAIFLPNVFHSVETLLLKSLELANASLDNLASIGHLVQ